MKNIDSPSFLVNFISSNMNAEVVEKQKMLEVADLRERASLLLAHLTKELQMLEMKKPDPEQGAYGGRSAAARNTPGPQQMKTIQDELGGNPIELELEEMRDKAAKKQWTVKVSDTFDKEINKLQRMNPAGAEFSVQYNYVQLLLDLPWGDYSNDKFDLKNAQK